MSKELNRDPKEGFKRIYKYYTSFAEIVIKQSSPSATELSTLIVAPDSCLIWLMMVPPFPITAPMLAVGHTTRSENSFEASSSLGAEYNDRDQSPVSPLKPP